VLVRVNAAGTPWFDDDVEMCRRPGIAGIVLPKAENPAVIAKIRARVGSEVPILPLIETGAGLWNALDVARSRGVARLVFGSIDFQVDLGLRDDELTTYRAQLVLVSRVAGIASPVDGVTTAINDADTLARDVARARALGFGAKLCIHPQQVDAVNAAFRPTAEEIAWAERVVAADAAAGGAAVAVDGKMVDRPVLLKAREILAGAAPN
jgi:citrate lyase subunit beta/citryl-CoA lyase